MGFNLLTSHKSYLLEQTAIGQEVKCYNVPTGHWLTLNNWIIATKKGKEGETVKKRVEKEKKSKKNPKKFTILR